MNHFRFDLLEINLEGGLIRALSAFIKKGVQTWSEPPFQVF